MSNTLSVGWMDGRLPWENSRPEAPGLSDIHASVLTLENPCQIVPVSKSLIKVNTSGLYCQGDQSSNSGSPVYYFCYLGQLYLWASGPHIMPVSQVAGDGMR